MQTTTKLDAITDEPLQTTSPPERLFFLLGFEGLSELSPTPDWFREETAEAWPDFCEQVQFSLDRAKGLLSDGTGRPYQLCSIDREKAPPTILARVEACCRMVRL